MKELMNYIDSSLEGLTDDKYLYNYKKRIVSEITERANEITHTGISDEKVIADIIKSQYPDIRKDYENYRISIDKKREAKSRRRKTLLGSVIYFSALVLVFLLVSFIKRDWARSWIFLVNGVCLYIAYMCLSTVMTLSEKIDRFRIISRALIAISVFNFALPVFLVLAILLNVSHPWLVFLFAILIMLIADGIFIEKINNRFAIFYHIAYILPAMTSLYFILGTMRIIRWHPGWLMIPASFLIMFIVIAARLSIHKKQGGKFDETEDDREWNAD